MQKRIIKIANKKIFLTQDFCLDISDTSLTGEYLTFRSTREIYFKVHIVEFKDKIITLDIIDYEPDNIDSFLTQNAKADITFIKFLPMNWIELEKNLSIYTKGRLIKQGIILSETTTTDSLAKNSFSSVTNNP